MIKVMRASGMPVRIENLDAFQQTMRETYDKIMLREGIDVNKGIFLEEAQAKRMQALLDRVERILRKRYPAVETWPVLKSARAMKAAVTQHGPIMMAKDSETGEPIYVIYDVEI
jgi:hypothetical protein